MINNERKDDILDIKGSMPDKTEKLFKLFAQGNELENFVLVGGTALAIHLKHRTSEDLDFFVNRPVLDGNLQKKLKELIARAKANGYSVSGGDNDPDNICLDYKFDDIKVTFLAYDSKLLDRSEKYENLNIASVQQIAAMKMYTVLRYRTKIRDFYDIKCLITDRGYTFEKMLDAMGEIYGEVTFTDKGIERRFTKNAQDIRDEGLSSLMLKYNESFKSLQDFFKTQIKAVQEREIGYINKKGDELIEGINDAFGLQRTPALMLLYNQGRKEEIYENDLAKFCNKLDRKDLNGASVFSYLSKDPEALDYFLSNMKELPQKMEFVEKSKPSVEIQKVIDFHRLLNRCLEKSPNQIDKILEGKDVNREDFYKKLEEKREKFNIKGYEMKKDANVEYVEALMGVRELDGKEKTDILLGKDWVEVEDQAITRDKVLGVKEPERKAPSNDEMDM